MLENAFKLAENLNPTSPDFKKSVKELSVVLSSIKGNSAVGLSVVKNRVASVCSALNSKSMSNKQAYSALEGIAGELEPLVGKRRKTVEAAAKPTLILKELSDLGKVKDLFKKTDATLKSFGVDLDDEFDRKQETEWLDHTRTENDYEAGLGSDADKQKNTIESFSETIPKLSTLKSKINKSGWTWVMSPLLVVFGVAPSADALRRSRLETQNLTMGHHSSQRLRGETGKLGTIINKQMLLVFPSSIIKNPEEFESEIAAAKSTLEMRLGALDIVTTANAPKKPGRLTETTKVDFTPLAPPTPPVEPTPPAPLKSKQSKDKEAARAYLKLKEKYDKDMKAFKAALPEYNKKYEAYEAAIANREKAIRDVRKKETKKLSFDSNSYFRSILYPKLVFVWIMRKSQLSTIMPMRIKDVGFPSLREDAELKREEKLSGSVSDALRVRNHVAEMLRNIEQNLTVSASALEAIKVSYESTLALLKKQKPNTTMFKSLQNTLATLKVNIEQKKADLEKEKKAVPELIKAARSMQDSMQKLVHSNR